MKGALKGKGRAAAAAYGGDGNSTAPSLDGGSSSIGRAGEATPSGRIWFRYGVGTEK